MKKSVVGVIILFVMGLISAQADLANFTDTEFLETDWATTVYQTGASTGSSHALSGQFRELRFAPFKIPSSRSISVSRKSGKP